MEDAHLLDDLMDFIGKSVAETRSKFYALRDLYEKEKKAVRKQRTSRSKRIIP